MSVLSVHSGHSFLSALPPSPIYELRSFKLEMGGAWWGTEILDPHKACFTFDWQQMAMGRSIATMQSNSGFGIYPLPCTVNHKQDRPDLELVSEFPIRLCPPHRHSGHEFELSGGRILMGNPDYFPIRSALPLIDSGLNGNYGSNHCCPLSITGKADPMGI